MEIETKKLIVDFIAGLWVVSVSVLSGIVSHFHKLDKDKKQFIAKALAIDIGMCMVVGLMTFHGCKYLNLDLNASAAISIYAGHMGARAFGVVGNYFKESKGSNK
mgnify:CR=1 FL=1